MVMIKDLPLKVLKKRKEEYQNEIVRLTKALEIHKKILKAFQVEIDSRNLKRWTK